MSFNIYYNMNSATLDSKNKSIIRGLSIWRAKSVVQYMQSLGLKANYTIQAPGHENLNIAQSRRASGVVSWSTGKKFN